jgi:hypothetical protein
MYGSGSRVRLGELDSGAKLGYISPHTHEWIPKLCSYISVSRMTSSKQVAAAVIIRDECGVNILVCREQKQVEVPQCWTVDIIRGQTASLTIPNSAQFFPK